MKIKTVRENSFLITLSNQECKVLQKVFKKNLELISDREFQSRTGFLKTDVGNLHSIFESHLGALNLQNKTEQNSRKTLCLSLEEALVLHQSLNEVCHGIRIANFTEEIGLEKEFLETYLNYIDTTLFSHESRKEVNQKGWEL